MDEYKGKLPTISYSKKSQMVNPQEVLLGRFVSYVAVRQRENQRENKELYRASCSRRKLKKKLQQIKTLANLLKLRTCLA